MVLGTVAVVKTDDSYSGVQRALTLIREEILEKVDGRRKFLIKPNFVSTWRYLSATPKPAVEAVLDFILENFNVDEVVVAESPALGGFEESLRNFGYYELKRKYSGIEFIDLDSYEQERFTLEDKKGRRFDVYVSKLVLDERFVKISPCRAKTHDTVVVTLSIKNVVMGSIKRGYKSSMHKGYYSINYNIAKLAVKMMPDLGIIDGVKAMEGDGPVSGDAKKWGVVFASVNPVNLDVAASYAMGFNPSNIGYLYFLSRWGHGEIDPRKIKTLGEELDHIKTRFKPHRTYSRQLTWKTQ